ncbi:uncharacterized protein SPPG_00294 [Spizellomyces punctatus DAOM BR117]|uniref:UBC core domain-containing protein n=1 Tax=Spizellomyces punctatus (strain DAOM BR117) TaxID=645134 RepID=A0A0L0HU08_SPIPD|nr:uncharacterized protein SPPG_00294 [Spizellomyces punctatus DAOM BR117]KND04573.1 hypothetical protein SPPG_00294 [Spizellomyces punctatus DAOM BR117]|eukprot:XP_016612612.1 hypothetical protein SPPG_00294 [Spizellomyces punctatus DAOM BR117]
MEDLNQPALAPSAEDSSLSASPSQYDDYLRRYELLLEFKHLNSGKNCPPGIYLKPSPDNVNEWHGVVFIHRGYYKEGVFKFIIQIPRTYPHDPPAVLFLTDMFHPLIGRDGYFNLAQQFPQWRPRRDYICHILHYIKNSFRESVLTSLQEHSCRNPEAYKMLHNERGVFAKLAAQCAQISVSQDIIFDNDDMSHIHFSPLTDEQFEDIKAQMILSVAKS